MQRVIRRAPFVSSLAALAILAGPMASAQASDASVRAAINSYNTKITKDEARILRAAATYHKTHRSAGLVAALKKEVIDLRALEHKLARQKASTANGHKGQADVIKGLSDIAKGYGSLAKEVKAASASKPVSAASLRAAQSIDKRGHNLVVKGLKLLAK